MMKCKICKEVSFEEYLVMTTLESLISGIGSTNICQGSEIQPSRRYSWLEADKNEQDQWQFSDVRWQDVLRDRGSGHLQARPGLERFEALKTKAPPVLTKTGGAHHRNTRRTNERQRIYTSGIRALLVLWVMDPKSAANELRRIAAAIDNSKRPSKVLVARALKGLVGRIAQEECTDEQGQHQSQQQQEQQGQQQQQALPKSGVGQKMVMEAITKLSDAASKGDHEGFKKALDEVHKAGGG